MMFNTQFSIENESLFKAAKAEMKLKIEIERDRINATYGVVDDCLIPIILRYERKADACARCNGTNCIYKTGNKNIFKVKDGVLLESNIPCEKFSGGKSRKVNRRSKKHREYI